MQHAAELVAIATKFLSLAPLMDERMRRQWAATESRAYGWGEFDRLGLDGGVSLGDDDGFTGDASDLLRGDEGRRCEAPGAVDDHANAEAEAGILRDIGHGEGPAGAAFRRETEPDALVADAHDTNIGVGGSGLFGFRQRHGAELFELGIRRPGILRRGEEPGGQGGGRGREEIPASQHLGIVSDALECATGGRW